MYTKNYLNISLHSYSDSSKITEGSVSLIICSNEEHLKQFEPRPQVVQKVKLAMESKKGTVLSFFAEKPYLVIINASDESENWRITGADLYKKLESEKIKTAHLFGLSHLNTAMKTAFLEGLLLGSYKFTKYNKDATNDEISVYISESSLPQTELKQLNALINAVSNTKTMVNEPVNFLDGCSLYLSKAAA